MEMLQKSYNILDSLRTHNGLYRASPSVTYNFCWVRDTFYEVLPYLDKDCGRYEQTYWSLLDILRKYEWKIDYHNVHKPQDKMHFLHARYSIDTNEEVDQEWGNSQGDAYGALLFGIGMGVKAGKRIIRDDKDKEIVQKLVGYFECIEYWDLADNGVWEEEEEIHMSSVGAIVAGLKVVQDFVFVPQWLIDKGLETINRMFPLESGKRHTDLIQLSLIYPFNVLTEEQSQIVIQRVKDNLLRKRGVIRYKGDSYYSTKEHDGRHLPYEHFFNSEPAWSMGILYLGLAKLQLGEISESKRALEWTENIMLEDGSIPELRYAKSDKHNENTALGWSQALYCILHEKLDKVVI